MIFWYLLILVVTLVNVKVCRKGFFPDYLGKEQCNAVKGVFILLVFMAHVQTFIMRCGFSFDKPTDGTGRAFSVAMGQLVVTLFFFYSGYGVMKSLMAKGDSYLDTYPKKRLLTTLLNFDVAVICFVFLAWILGEQVGLPRILLSLIGWSAFGNSNWYIFVILCCYLAFYLVFKVFGTRYRLGAAVLAVIVLAGMLALRACKSPFWYTTMLVFPAGTVYALYSEKLEHLIQQRYWLSVILLLAAFLSLGLLVKTHPLHGLTFNAKSIVFALLIVTLTMKVRIGNQWLRWCGFSLFPLYIYQRLPMISLRGIAGEGWVCAHPHVFIGLCFLITVGIAWLYNKFFRIKLT